MINESNRIRVSEIGSTLNQNDMTCGFLHLVNPCFGIRFLCVGLACMHASRAAARGALVARAGAETLARLRVMSKWKWSVGASVSKKAPTAARFFILSPSDFLNSSSQQQQAGACWTLWSESTYRALAAHEARSTSREAADVHASQGHTHSAHPPTRRRALPLCHSPLLLKSAHCVCHRCTLRSSRRASS